MSNMFAIDVTGVGNAVPRRLGCETFAEPIDGVRGTNIGIYAHNAPSADPCVTSAVFIPNEVINKTDTGLVCTSVGFGPIFTRLSTFLRADTYRMVTAFVTLWAYRTPDGCGVYLIRYASMRTPDPVAEERADAPQGEHNRPPRPARAAVIDQPEHIRRATVSRREFPVSSMTSNDWLMRVLDSFRHGRRVDELNFFDNPTNTRTIEAIRASRRNRDFGVMVDMSDRDIEAAIRAYLTLASADVGGDVVVPANCRVSDLTLQAAVALHRVTARRRGIPVPDSSQLFTTVSFASPVLAEARIFRVSMPRHMAHAICIPHEYIPCSRWNVSRLFPNVSVDDLNNALRRRVDDECAPMGGASDIAVEAAHIAHGIIPATDNRCSLERLLQNIARGVDEAYAPAITTSATVDERVRAASARMSAIGAIESVLSSTSTDLPCAVRAAVTFFRAHKDNPSIYHIGDYAARIEPQRATDRLPMVLLIREHLSTRPSVATHFTARLMNFERITTESCAPQSIRVSGILCFTRGTLGEHLDSSFMSQFVTAMVVDAHRSEFRFRELCTSLIVAQSATLQHSLSCGKLALAAHGAPGGGKTHMSELVRLLMLPGTVKNEIHSSGQAFLNGNNYGYTVLVNDESSAYIGADEQTINTYKRTLRYSVESGLLRTAHERFSRIAISGTSNIDVSRTVQGADESAPGNYSTQTLHSTLMDGFIFMTNASKGAWSAAMFDRLLTMHIVPNQHMVRELSIAASDEGLGSFGRVERPSTQRTGAELAIMVFQSVQAQMLLTSQASMGGVNRSPSTAIVDRFQSYYNMIKVRLGTSLRMATRTDLMATRLALTAMRLRVAHMQQMYLLGTGKPSEMTPVTLGCSSGPFEVVNPSDCMTALAALAPGGDGLTGDVHRALCDLLCGALHVRVAVVGNASRHVARYDPAARRVLDGGAVPPSLSSASVQAAPADVPRGEFIPDDRFSVERMLALAAEQNEITPSGMIRVTDFRTTGHINDDVIPADIARNLLGGRVLPDGMMVQGHGGARNGRLPAEDSTDSPQSVVMRANAIRALAKILVSSPHLRKYRFSPSDIGMAPLVDVLVDIACTSFANAGVGSACATSLIAVRGADVYVHPRIFTAVLMLDDAVPVSMMLAPDVEVVYTAIDCTNFDAHRMVARVIRPIDPSAVETLRSIDASIANACSRATGQPVTQSPVAVPVQHKNAPVLTRQYIDSVYRAHITRTYPELSDEQNLNHIAHPAATHQALDYAEAARINFVRAATALRRYVGLLDDRGKAQRALDDPNLPPRSRAMLLSVANRDVAHVEVAPAFQNASRLLGRYLGYCSTRVGGLDYTVELQDVRVFMMRWGLVLDPVAAPCYHDGMERLYRMIYASVLLDMSTFPSAGSGDGPIQLVSPFPSAEARDVAWLEYRGSHEPFPPAACVPDIPNDDDRAVSIPVPIPAYVPPARAAQPDEQVDEDVFGPPVAMALDAVERIEHALRGVEEERDDVMRMAVAAFGEPRDDDLLPEHAREDEELFGPMPDLEVDDHYAGIRRAWMGGGEPDAQRRRLD